MIVELFGLSVAVLTNGGAWFACYVQYGGCCANAAGGTYQCSCPAGGDPPELTKPCPVSARRRPLGPNQAPYTTFKHKVSRFTTCVFQLLRAALVLQVGICAAKDFDLLASAESLS